MPVRNELQREGVIQLRKVELGNGYIQDRTIAVRDAILSLFTEDEVAIVDEVIEELWHQNASEVSDASHDVRWRVLQMKDSIPYEFAYIDNSPISAIENQRTRELAQELGW